MTASRPAGAPAGGEANGGGAGAAVPIRGGRGRSAAIAIEGVTVSYQDVTALRELTADVREGEVFGLLGPNGAGKTTTLSAIEGLVTPSAGTIRILGRDVASDPRRARRGLGVGLQRTAFVHHLKVWEQVGFFASLYDCFPSKRRVLELLGRFGLDEVADRIPWRLSGGQQQRLACLIAVVHEPAILILDEPTVGLDPQARRLMWEVVRMQRDAGRTVLVTTHYMDEAEELCDRVGIIHRGRLLALDSPGRLIRSLDADTAISVTPHLPAERVWAVRGVTRVGHEGPRLIVRSKEPTETVLGLQLLAAELRTPLADLRLRAPNLEDVFVALTGESAAQDDDCLATAGPAFA
jgi:ABC-2 type transport system ATP-binding protein